MNPGISREAFAPSHGNNNSTHVLGELLSSKDVAEILGVHHKTVERKARIGEIPGHFKLNRWYFFPSELDKWMRVCVPSDSQSVRVN
jgi:excisionase family DNA binding protein